MQSIVCNEVKGGTVTFAAKAKEDSIFICWKNEDTNEVYSNEPVITIDVKEALNLKAVFKTFNDGDGDAMLDYRGIVGKTFKPLCKSGL